MSGMRIMRYYINLLSLLMSLNLLISFSLFYGRDRNV